MGGNLTLVHLGRDRVDPLVKKGVVFSVPCDLAASARALEKPSNRFYMKRFLVMLHQKIKDKMAIMPHALNDPFLPPECFPVAEAIATPNITLKMPKSVGHVGFVSFNKRDLYWSEQQAIWFLNRPL